MLCHPLAFKLNCVRAEQLHSTHIHSEECYADSRYTQTAPYKYCFWFYAQPFCPCIKMYMKEDEYAHENIEQTGHMAAGTESLFLSITDPFFFTLITLTELAFAASWLLLVRCGHLETAIISHRCCRYWFNWEWMLTVLSSQGYNQKGWHTRRLRHAHTCIHAWAHTHTHTHTHTHKAPWSDSIFWLWKAS